ncbi:Jag N-terminal domain-containing protein [Campylobacter curvus]|uniref:Jag N-terminal domain-containing protein n=1 Tax=Campylobacter curvus TaxID=200 RepID=UPI0003670168|nr:Jag N-terminal domain-containing protein [Campylobacter curvus]QKF61422.1 Jag domain-containing protein [Campylobacter curvus]UEB49733.1 Jag N-terminal domain-containing protein [Campylobacter curvus]
MRIEAENLQEAFQKAASELKCSVTELDIKVIQHPSGGIFGFFKKSAIIEAVPEKQNQKLQEKFKNKHEQKQNNHKNNTDNKNESRHTNGNNSSKHDEQEAKSVNSGVKREHTEKKRNRHKKNREDKEFKTEKAGPSLSEKNSTLAHAAFADKTEDENLVTEFEVAKPEYVIKRIDDEKNDTSSRKKPSKDILDTSILENFNQESTVPESRNEPKKAPKEPIDFDKILPEIKDGLNKLFAASCFDITKIEVSKFNDDTVLIELDGGDAALLIGKEGYRYKAISYLLYNWLNVKYNLAIRLEIAEFLKNQEAMIEQYLNGVIERVQNTGRAQTKPLDGVLVKIALEKLREKFPQKYVGIKSGNDGKFVVVNDFFKK